MFDTLEQRRLLSVSATFDSAQGLIDVVGSDKPDRIDVALEHVFVKPTEPILHGTGTGAYAGAYEPGTSLECTLPAPPTTGPLVQSRVTPFEVVKRTEEAIESAIVSVTVNGQLARRWTLPLSALKEVRIEGAGGDDVLGIYNYATPMATAVFAGDGRDLVVVTNSMGATGSLVYGGDGDDVIHLISTRGAFAGHVAYGDAGDDVIFGSENADLIWGDDDGIREVDLPQGNDLVFAGGGDDRVWGGGGDDSLHGDNGDDWLCGDAGFDYIDGDDGYDTGVFDDNDKFERIEELIVFA